MTDGGFRRLRVYQVAHDLGLRVHAMSLGLPKFEMYEEGSQIRRSSKRISASIVEGYAMRKYKGQYLFYLYRAYGSAEETLEHLEYLYGTGSLRDKDLYEELLATNQELNRQLFRFIQGVERDHRDTFTVSEEEAEYVTPPEPDDDPEPHS